MKKLGFLFFCISYGLYAQSGVSLDSAVQQGVHYLMNRIPRNSRVAVLSIQNADPELSAYVLQKISAALVNGDYFTLVERNSADLGLLSQEMLYQLSGEVSDETSLSLGKQLGTEFIIKGGLYTFGSGYRLELKALQVENAQIAAFWSAEQIRPDPAWSSSKNAVLIFTGDSLSGPAKQTLAEGLRNALSAHNIDIELEEGGGAAQGYGFTFAVSSQPLQAAPPANTLMLTGEVSLVFSRNGKVLCKAGPYYITEMSLPLLVRRGAEQLRGDQSFFKKINQSLSP